MESRVASGLHSLRDKIMKSTYLDQDVLSPLCDCFEVITFLWVLLLYTKWYASEQQQLFEVGSFSWL